MLSQAWADTATVPVVLPKVWISGQLQEAPQQRLGFWLRKPNGEWLSEWLSCTPSSQTVDVWNCPQAMPPADSQLLPLASQFINWPGVIGRVIVSPMTKALFLVPMMYQDINQNHRHDDGESLQELFPSYQRYDVIWLYSKNSTVIRADAGFEVHVQAGWNTLGIRSGRLVHIESWPALSNVQFLP